ncbi:MAG: hypothetical protein MUP98_09015 [Candidatus Aminicenantes bacterium]|nr:hypothetical protein [Candidatus Aminicenantes bacterium]
MDQKEIIERIDAIKKELAADQFEIIKEKILERKFHHHKSDRKFLLGRFIEGMRRRLMLEIEMILEPMLDNQKEINLRLLEETRRLKKEVAAFQTFDVAPKHVQHIQKDPSENQK